MNILTRAKHAIEFLRTGKMPNAAPAWWKRAIAEEAFHPYWDQMTANWEMENYQSFASEGFAGNPVIFAAIMYKVRAISSAPLRVYRGTRDNHVLADESHPLAQLVARPNPEQGWYEFQALNTI